MSNGVVLERLSGKKLSILVSILFLIQILFFLLGGFVFPNATHSESILAAMCRFRSGKGDASKELIYLRDDVGKLNGNCDRVDAELDDPLKSVNPNDVVYVFQAPLPRNNMVLTLNRLFQTVTCVMHFSVGLETNENNKIEITNEEKIKHKIPISIKLGYSNLNDKNNWHQLANEKVEKNFICNKIDNEIDCDLVQLFELGNVHHQFYLVNLKFEENILLNKLTSLSHTSTVYPKVHVILTFIYQTGGFTQMWFIMKSIFFPILLIIMIWYWQRIVKLDRPSNLIERNLFAVGLACTLLNLPIDWLTLYFDFKWMLLYSDIRQGIFYLTLFTFWIIFCGEHFIDDSEMNSSCKTFKSYWKSIIIVWFAFLCLFIFELCERGMQLSNPFFSVWDTKTSSNVATTVLILALLAGISYFLLILYFVIRIFMTFRSKQTQLPHMSRMRRLFYEGIIYRFKFLLISTLVCVALTISFAIANNYNQTSWKFESELTFNYSSAFLTGVYAMWNVYVSALMMFYAPSHKNKDTNGDINDENGETVQFVNLTANYKASSNKTESIVTKFASKIVTN